MITNKDKMIITMIINKDKMITNKDKMITNKDKMIINKDKMIINKDKMIINKDKMIINTKIKPKKLNFFFFFYYFFVLFVLLQLSSTYHIKMYNSVISSFYIDNQLFFLKSKK